MSIPDSALAAICNAAEEYCGLIHGHSSSSPAAPSRDNTVRINPSSVPLEKALGLGFILYDGLDVGLVKGLGRVGAALSPSNSEETFFGPPGIELPEDYLYRKQHGKKYPSQKITLATAFGLYRNKRSGLSRFELNFGVMGKYNRLSHEATPGGGVSGVLGPFTYGYSLYQDQTVLDYRRYGLDTRPLVRFTVETFSLGVFLNDLVVDYSILRMVGNEVATTSVLTGSLLLKKVMLTGAIRNEASSRPIYDASRSVLENQRIKGALFAGAQFNAWRGIMLGVFYNYYLLGEFSLGLTWFL